MANFLCTKCDHYRRECTCKKPKVLVFTARHQAQAGGKRRLEGEESYTTRRSTKEELCQYGCGATSLQLPHKHNLLLREEDGRAGPVCINP
eukprot:1754181-Rhodomonas_salina.1